VCYCYAVIRRRLIAKSLPDIASIDKLPYTNYDYSYVSINFTHIYVYLSLSLSLCVSVCLCVYVDVKIKVKKVFLKCHKN